MTRIRFNPNLVDFSNPESVAQMQVPILNPYGYYNPYANPNIIHNQPNMPQPDGFTTTYVNPRLYNNMYQQQSPSYGYRNEYYNMDNLSAADTAKFMIPKGKKELQVEVVRVEKPPKPTIYDGLTYHERKLLPLHVTVSKGNVHKPPKRKRQIRVEYKKYEYRPDVPITREDLDPTLTMVKFFVDTPLDWSREDAKEVVDLLDKIYVYDIALTMAVGEFVVGKTPGFKEYSREKYERMMQYLENKLEEYKRNEMEYRNIIDYRAPYRYKELPIYTVDEDDNIIIPIQPDPVAMITKDHLTGDKVYRYDRGTDYLTVEEWEIFKRKAIEDMWRGMKKIEALEFCELNKHMYQEESEPKNEEPVLPKYDPNDAVSVKLHSLREYEREYNNHKNFYRHVLRHRCTEEEFDNWWYGTSTKVAGQIDAEKEEEQRIKEMHRRHLQFLHTLQPVNYAEQGAICRQMMINRLREYDKGLETPDMSLSDCMALLGYLGIVRPHEINMERQQREEVERRRQMMSQRGFRQSLYNMTNNWKFDKNPNPHYIPKYGTIDPRFNMPSNYVDLTNNTESQNKARIVYQAAANMGRHPRLHTIYK